MEKPLVGDIEAQDKVYLIHFKDIKRPKENEEILDGETFFQEASEECLLNLPTLPTGKNPITIRDTANHQSRDIPLQMACRDSNRYNHIEMHNTYFFCFTANPGEQWKIVLHTPLLMEVLKWYHIILCHCVIQRLYDTVRARFHADGLHNQCIAIVRHCSNEYQRAKENGRQYGKLPPRDAGYSPF